MAILLWLTLGCMFEVNPQPFLFAGFFEGNIFLQCHSIGTAPMGYTYFSDF